MSRFFIDRPKFAWVVALFISLAGLLAIPSLPVAQFPVVAPPQVTINVSIPARPPARWSTRSPASSRRS